MNARPTARFRKVEGYAALNLRERPFADGGPAVPRSTKQPLEKGAARALTSPYFLSGFNMQYLEVCVFLRVLAIRGG